MNHSPRLTVSLLAIALVTGCASQATLRIDSEPQGAYITDDSGRLLGTAPVDVRYLLDENSRTCVETEGFSAHWVSGVEERINPLVLCDTGYNSTLIYRDFSKPGLAEDRQFALQIEMLELQQAQTRAAQDAAQAAWASAAAARDAAYAARWSGRSGYRDRGGDRDYRYNEWDRDNRYDNRDRDSHDDRGNRDLEDRNDGAVNPGFSGGNGSYRDRDRIDREGNITSVDQVPPAQISETNPITPEDAARLAALQEEQTVAEQEQQALAEQAVAEQVNVEAAAEEARLIALQEEQARAEQAAAEAAVLSAQQAEQAYAEAQAAQARLLAQQEEQIRAAQAAADEARLIAEQEQQALAEQVAAERQAADAEAEEARVFAQQAAEAEAAQVRLLAQQQEQARAVQAAAEAVPAGE